ncbi:MAG: hypothetical protein ABGW97_03040 [Christiangramia sp.]|uniref:hypothetical protein n=1 Tax=Christiangramia sp. TaxID=1931228 RepID=UPI0032424413
MKNSNFKNQDFEKFKESFKQQSKRTEISTIQFKKDLEDNSFESKVEKQRLSRSNKNSKTESSFVKKASKSILDGIRRKKKAKGDAIAEKVRKQREARNPKREKKVEKDPKKVKSIPFYLG